MDHRRFFAALLVLPTAAPAQPPAAPPADPPRPLTLTGADLGTLAAELERVAAATRYSLRFPSPRFSGFAKYRAAARAAVLDALSYFTDKVEPRPGVPPMRKAHLDTHSFVHFLPGLHRLMDFPDLAALAAPRVLLVEQCRQDRLFPPEGMTAAVDRIAEAYAAAQCPAHSEGRVYEEPHRFTRAMQDDAFAWLDRHLKA
ncbi:MAG: hypothetical protein U0804_02605 [Gemmataceae bacterium]